MNKVLQRYAGCRLDRTGALHKDPAWIRDRLADPTSRIMPVWRNRNLIKRAQEADGTPDLNALHHERLAGFIDAGSELVFLGMEADTAVFALDLSMLSESESEAVAGGAEFLDLRRIGPFMRADRAALAAYARSALRWHRYSRYCGHCGAISESRHAGHLRVCSNASCGREIYPRTDPAVIMLVEHLPTDGSPASCLLANHHRSPAGNYSTLAGFVEPGESLEEAVAREVFEEVGIRLGSIEYQGSQPWPFPSSIMLGFRAVAESTSLDIDTEEISDARWFTPDQLERFGDWGDPSAKLRLSPKDSIARYLIDSWMEEVANR